MNSYIKALATAVLTIGILSPVQAAQVVFKEPFAWAGTGCSAGSTSVTGVNTEQLAVLFDSYEAGVGASNGLTRVACSFSVPISVPDGYQVSGLTVDWEGYVEGKGQLKRKYKLIGSGIAINPSYGAWKTNSYNIPSGGNFIKRDMLYNGSVAPCGGSEFKLRINSQVRALGSNAYAVIDSADLANRLIFKVQFQPC